MGGLIPVGPCHGRSKNKLLRTALDPERICYRCDNHSAYIYTQLAYTKTLTMATNSNIQNLNHAHLVQLFLLAFPLFIHVAQSQILLPVIPQAVSPDLSKRGSFLGGWAVYTPGACPDQTSSCSYTSFCCPTSTVCYTEGLAGAVACCPDRKHAHPRLPFCFQIMGYDCYLRRIWIMY